MSTKISMYFYNLIHIGKLQDTQMIEHDDYEKMNVFVPHLDMTFQILIDGILNV